MSIAQLPGSYLRLAGISAILAGIIIICFALISDSHGLFFFYDIYTGGSVEPWIGNVRSNPELSRIIMALPVLGFSCFLITGLVLFQLLPVTIWQKNLSIAGYGIGVPISILMWIIQLSLMNHVMLTYGQPTASDAQMNSLTSFVLFFFHIMNDVFGPLFIIVSGSGMLAWSALRAELLPKWFCYAGMLIAIIMILSFLAVSIPEFRVLSFIAPVHMIWYIGLGVYLLKLAKKG